MRWLYAGALIAISMLIWGIMDYKQERAAFETSCASKGGEPLFTRNQWLCLKPNSMIEVTQ
jgi:hypothetical protein